MKLGAIEMNGELLGMLRQRRVVISAVVAVVVLLIWLLAVFNPEGHKLSNVNGQVQAAETEQSALQARLDRLKLYSRESAQFEALEQRLAAALPSTTDIYNYITAISNAASSTGIKVQNVNPAAGTVTGGVAVIPVTLGAEGTYAQTLAFVQALDALPRLTIVTELNISGGGTGTSRSSNLVDQFDLEIFAEPSAVPKAS